MDEVADRQDEVRVEQVGVGDRLLEHLDALGRSAGAVAEDDEVEHVVRLRQREHLCRFAIGAHRRRIRRG